MAGNFPFALDAINSITIRKSGGSGINIVPWTVNSLSPLISLTIDENIFNPLMSGTIIVKDIGDWSNEMQLSTFDEVAISLNFKEPRDELNGDGTGSTIGSKSFIFEITSIKNTVDAANKAYQNAVEKTKVLTIEFTSKNILSKEFLSSILDDENFIGPIVADKPVKVELDGEKTSSIEMKGFNKYLANKTGIQLDAEPTSNFCYLKKNNVSYPWGKLRGQPTILQTLQYLSENAISAEKNVVANYLFWQDFSGFHFKSMNKLIEENSQSDSNFSFSFSDIDLLPSTIRSFNTLREFDAFATIGSGAYFSWYERIDPDYDDPYLDFVDSTDSLIRSKVFYDVSSEYKFLNHIEKGKIISSGATASLNGNYSMFTESTRKDDDIYGFYSKNRYNTPHPQEWDYLGITADQRLTNVVWQTQYDIDNKVKPEIAYVYDKIIKKSLLENRQKYVELKNAKRKWEVYRCSVCCSYEQGGTADRKLIGDMNPGSPDYVYYFGKTGIFGDLVQDGYGVVAAGGFSDVVNYIPGVTGVSGNGLTLSYNLNEKPYNQTISEFYHIKNTSTQLTQQIDKTILEYQNELNRFTPYISRIENFLSKVDGWVVSSTEFAYNNLTPDYLKTCSTEETNPGGLFYPGTGTECCNNLDLQKVLWADKEFIFGYPSKAILNYYRVGDGLFYRFNFGGNCGIKKLPLYVNLQYSKSNPFDPDFDFYVEFCGYYNLFINYIGDPPPYYVTPYAYYLNILNGPNIKFIDGPYSFELPFQKPGFLYECTKTKLMTGSYYRTYEDPAFVKGEQNIFTISDESSFLDTNILNSINNETVWCASCLDPIALRQAKYEFTKVLKQLKLRQFTINTLITKLQAVKSLFQTRYEEYLNRKAFFISKNPFEGPTLQNVGLKTSPLNLYNVKSIKRKPIRGSKYEVLAKKIGITSGAGQYVYNIYFDDNTSRNPGVTGNHPYYDQKYKMFNQTLPGYSQNYLTKKGFDTELRLFNDAYYYDNDLGSLVNPTNKNPPIGLDTSSLPPTIESYLVLPKDIFALNSLNYPTSWSILPASSLSFYLPQNTTLETVTNKYNIFTSDDLKKPASLVKEEISSYVRIEFITPIGLDRLVEFPTGFVRDAGFEYFLPYLVQLTAGPNGRQSIQSNVAVIGMDPYGFDVAVKKIKSKNKYSEYKQWGHYWWNTPLNRFKIDLTTRDIPDMALWPEKEFQNEFTYFENNGKYYYDIGEDYSEYDNYLGNVGGLFLNLGRGNLLGAFYSPFRLTFYFYLLNQTLNNLFTPTDYYIPIKDKYGSEYEQSYVKLPKQAVEKNISSTKYASYNLLSSHLHHNVRRSWYDFSYPSNLYFSTVLNKIANLNNQPETLSTLVFDVKTVLKADDFYAFGGNDFSIALDNSIALKDSAELRAFLQANQINELIFNDLNIGGDDLLSELKGISGAAQNGVPQLFKNEIEIMLNSQLCMYKPGLLTNQVWLYDLFGESEYGLTSPPTLPPEYDIFDENFAAQFVVFSRSSTESNICKKLNLKCVNPNGPVSNEDCPPTDPYCRCPAKNIMPKEREPSYKELAQAYEKTKECKLIENNLGKKYLGCIISDDQNIASCNCPEQGEKFPDLLRAIRTNSTFYNTPPETPLRRQAQMMMFNGQRAVMVIFPNDNLKIGSMVTINKPNPTIDYQNRYDRISGKWMVTGISRVFKSTNIEHMIVTLNRDSYYQEKSSSSSASTYKKDIF